MPLIEITPAELIGQIIGILAPILTVISYQLNTKKSILIALTGATVATAVGYLLIGATSGWSFQSTVKQPSLYLSVSPKHPQKWFGFPRRSPTWSVSDCYHTVLFTYVKIIDL